MLSFNYKQKTSFFFRKAIIVSAVFLFSGCVKRAPLSDLIIEPAASPRTGPGGALSINLPLLRGVNIPTGRIVRLNNYVGKGLTVTNRDEYPHTFTAEAVIPSNIPEGYLTLDSGWVSFDSSEFTLEPFEEKEIDILLKIPEEHSGGKNFLGTIRVLRKRSPHTGIFQLATGIRVIIITE